MPTKQELEDQLSITQKLVAAVDQMAKSMEKVESSLDKQVSAVERLTKAMGSLRDQDISSFNNIKLDGVHKELKKTEAAASSVTSKLNETAKTVSKKVSPAFAAGAGAVSGFVMGLKTLRAVGTAAGSVLGGIASFVWNLGAAIIAAPLKMLESLIDIAANAGGGVDELAQALENLREAMGDLRGPGTTAVIQAADKLQGFSDTGLSAWRVFGTLAQRIEYMTKLATSMGNTFNLVRHEFEQNGGAIAAYQKGLGISEEQMKSFGDRAITMGDTLSQTLLDTAKQTLALGKAFSIDQKLIGKDMAKAVVDVRHFGAVTIKEIGQASVYAHKLGVELDKIVGVLDQFETFDSAAESAAKLSQSFGVSVDAFQMMEAQNPADALDMLRKSFRDAGVDASSFTRQQAKLLATTTGLDDATVRQAFSAKNYGVSLDEIKKKSESAEKKTMTQAEAMKELSDSIKRLVMGGGSQLGSFWQQFLKGFLDGIQATAEFRTIMMNIKQALHVTFMEGLRLGQAFVDMFPGIKTFFQGIAEFFQPKKFQKMVGGVVDVLKDWMSDLQSSGGKASFPRLMDSLRKHFFDFFDLQSGAGRKMLSGFMTFSTIISNVLSDGIKWAGEKIKEGLVWLTGLIKDPSSIMSLGAAGASEGKDFVVQLLSPIVSALYESAKVIWPALKGLFVTLGEKLVAYVKSDEFLSVVKPVAYSIAGFLFGAAFIKAMVSAAIAAMAKGAVGIATGSAGIMKQVAEKASGISASPKAPEISKALPAASDSKQAVESGKALAQGGGISWGNVLKFLVGFAGAVTIGMAAVFGSIAIIRRFNIKSDELVMGIAAVGAAALAMLPAAASLLIVSKIPLDPVSTGLGILAIGASIAVMVGVIAASIYALSSFKSNDVKNITDAVSEMSMAFLKASAVILAAAAIGAAISASVGTGAAVLAVGLSAIVTAIGIMTGAIIGIMKSMEGISVGNGFDSKVKAFTSIMDSVVNFSKNMATMLDAVRPSFITVITRGDDTTKRFEQLHGMLNDFIGKPGGAGLIGIIETVIKAVGQLSNGGPKMLESARVFVDILGTVASLASAMKPPEKMFEAIDGFWTTSGDVMKAIDKVKEHAGTVTSGVKDVIDVFTKQVMPLVTNGMNDQQLKAAAAVGQLLGGVVQIAQGMTPSQGTLSALREVGGTFGRTEKISKENLWALGEIIKEVSDGLTKVLPAVMGSLKPVLDAMGNWHFSESDAAVFKSIGPVLGQMMVMVQSIVAQSSQFAQAKLPGPNVTEFLGKIGEVLPGFMGSVAGAIPKIFESLKVGIQQLSTGIKPKEMEMGIKAFASIMEVVNEVTKLSQIKQQVPAGGADVSGLPQLGTTLTETVKQISQFFVNIVSGGTGESPLAALSKAMGDATPLIKKFSSSNSILEPIKNTFSFVSEMGSSAAQMSTNLQNYANSIKTDGITPAVDAVKKMVAAANELDQALSDGNVNSVDIKAKLQRVATAVGLGGKAQMTVTNKMAQINVNMTVEMNAADLEKAMILRANSFVRQRLDFLAEKAGARPPLGGAEYSSSQSGVPALASTGP